MRPGPGCRAIVDDDDVDAAGGHDGTGVRCRIPPPDDFDPAVAAEQARQRLRDDSLILDEERLDRFGLAFPAGDARSVRAILCHLHGRTLSGPVCMSCSFGIGRWFRCPRLYGARLSEKGHQMQDTVGLLSTTRHRSPQRFDICPPAGFLERATSARGVWGRRTLQVADL